jgi:hypothetical protein
VVPWSLALLLMAVLAIGGCKKDTAPEGAAPAKKEGAAQEAGKGEVKRGEGEGKTPEAGKENRAAQNVATPDGVIAYGGISSLDDATTRISGVASKVSPTPIPPLGTLATSWLQKEFALTSMEWLDTTKPVKFAAMDPKANKDAAFLMFPVKSREAFEKALPEAKEANAEGNAFKYEAGFRPGYVNFAGNYAVFSRDAGLFAKGKDFLEGEFAKYEPKDPFEMVFKVGNLTRIFSDEMKGVRTQMAQEMARDTAASPFGGSAEMMKEQVDMLFDFVDQLDTAAVSARIDGDHVKLPFYLTAKSGSRVGEFFAAQTGRKVDMLAYAPKDSYLIFGGNFDPAKFSDWNELSMELLTEMLKLTPDEKTKLSDLMKRSMEAQTGESVVALHKDGQLALAMLAVGGAKDGKKLRELTYEVYGMLWTKVVDLIKAEAGTELPPELDISTFPKAVESLAKIAEPMGISLKLAQETHGDAPIDVIEIKIDYAKFPLAQEDPKAAEAMKALVGDKVVIAAGYGKDVYAWSMSPDAVARVKSVLDGKKGEVPAGVKAAIENGVPGASMVVYLSAVDAAKAFAAVPDLAPMRETIAGLKADSGAAFTFGGAQGGLQAILDVPVSHVQEMMKLAR